MGNGWTAKIITSCIAIITALSLASVPWAYAIHGRLTRIEIATEILSSRVGGLEIPPAWFVQDVQENTVAIKALTAMIQDNRDKLRDIERKP